MPLCRSTRRFSLKTLLRDATVMLAGTVLGILLSHMFFTERGDRVDIERLCGDGTNSMPHLTKRDGGNLKEMRSKRPPLPRPLAAFWGAMVSRKRDYGTGESLGSGNGPVSGQSTVTSEQTKDPSSSGSGSTDDQPGDTLVLEDKTHPLLHQPHPPSHQQLLVGVLLAHPNKRLLISNTWAAQVKLLKFFSSSDNKSVSGDNHTNVALQSNHDNDLQPHRNAYRMLKYIHDNVIDDFDWLLLADDQTYLRVENMGHILDKLDPTQEQCLLHSELGGQRDPKFHNGGQLDNGLGGPGIIFSRTLLKKMAPHLEECLANSSISENGDDMDIEKCMQKRIELQCTILDEMIQLVVSDSLKDDIITNSYPDQQTSDQLHTALTLRPIREPRLMYRLHQFYIESAINTLKSRTNQLISELDQLNSLTDSS